MYGVVITKEKLLQYKTKNHNCYKSTQFNSVHMHTLTHCQYWFNTVCVHTQACTHNTHTHTHTYILTRLHLSVRVSGHQACVDKIVLGILLKVFVRGCYCKILPILYLSMNLLDCICL